MSDEMGLFADEGGLREMSEAEIFEMMEDMMKDGLWNYDFLGELGAIIGPAVEGTRGFTKDLKGLARGYFRDLELGDEYYLSNSTETEIAAAFQSYLTKLGEMSWGDYS